MQHDGDKMKISKLFLLGIFLLLVFTLGSVSAQDNATNISLEEIGDADYSIVNSEDELAVDYTFDIDVPDSIVKGEQSFIVVNLPDDVDGNLSVRIDDEMEYFNQKAGPDNKIDLKDLNLEFKTHKFDITFFNDSQYKTKTQSFNIDYKYYDVVVPDPIIVDEDDQIDIKFASDAAGTLIVFVDGDKFFEEPINDLETKVYFGNLNPGFHTYKIEYEGNYPRFEKTGNVTVDFYIKTFYDKNLRAGESFRLSIRLPSALTEDVVVDVEGKKYMLEYDEFYEFYEDLTIDDLPAGEYNFTLTYQNGSIVKTSHESFKILPIIIMPSVIDYNCDADIYMDFGKNAEGNLTLMVDNKMMDVKLENGVLNYSLINLELGYHSVGFNYSSPNYCINNVQYIKVTPIITAPHDIYFEDALNVTVEVPTTSGIEYIEIFNKDNQLMGNETLVNGKAQFRFENMQKGSNWLQVLYYVNNHAIVSNLYVTVHEESPEINMSLKVPNVALGGDVIRVELKNDVEGNILYYIDGKFFCFDELYCGKSYIYLEDILNEINLSYGNHVITAKYVGNYYIAKDQSATFNYTYIAFKLPENNTVLVDSKERVDIRLADDVTGHVSVIVDGVEVKNAKIYYDEEGFSSIDLYLDGLELKEYKDVVFKYTGNYPTCTYTASFNVSYEITVDESKSEYGEDLEIYVVFPHDATGSANVTIDDKTYNKEIINGKIDFYVSDLTIGFHNVTVGYAGDNKYFSKSTTAVVEVYSEIKCPDEVYVTKNDTMVSLYLPDDANGTLLVYVDNQLYANRSLESGFVNVGLYNLKLGLHQICATYVGSDYNVENVSCSLEVVPEVIIPEIRIFETKEIIIKFPDDATGKLYVMIDSKSIPVNLTGGQTNIIISDFEEGLYDLYIKYWDDEKYGDYAAFKTFYVDRIDSKANATAPKTVIMTLPIAITLTLPKDATGSVSVYFLDDYEEDSLFAGESKVKNGKAVINVDSKESGNYTLRWYYDGDNKYDVCYGDLNVTVLPKPKIQAKDLTVTYGAGSLYKVRIYDSFGKLVKTGYVTFKINSKTIKTVKIDKNGYAKLKITQAPKTYKITTTYEGISVTKKLTVKHILTLKSIKVKKSAKKLVLTAVLKKINGKYIKGKITFKFNGKTYKAKTTSKGVAKVTIGSKVLTKLKVGKKVTYQATYLKDTVKKTVKVKK